MYYYYYYWRVYVCIYIICIEQICQLIGKNATKNQTCNKITNNLQTNKLEKNFVYIYVLNVRKLFQKLPLYINVYNVIYIYPSSYTIEVFICINRVIYFSRNKKVFSIIFLQEYLIYLDILLCISSILGWLFVHFFLGLLIVILS